MSQLVSTGCIAYQQLMRTGYPSHINIDYLLDRFKQNMDFSKYVTKNQKEFCETLLRSCGLKWKDFRIGNKNVFFRNGKVDLLTESLKQDSKAIFNRYMRLKLVRAKWLFSIMLVIRYCSIRERQRIEDCAHNLTVNSSVNANLKKGQSNKKRKLDVSYTPTQNIGIHNR